MLIKEKPTKEMIRNLLIEDKLSYREIGKRYGICASAVYRILPPSKLVVSDLLLYNDLKTERIRQARKKLRRKSTM